jgi:hypothetical protein
LNDVIRSLCIRVGSELLPKAAVTNRQDHRTHEFARRFVGFVSDGMLEQYRMHHNTQERYGLVSHKDFRSL